MMLMSVVFGKFLNIFDVLSLMLFVEVALVSAILYDTKAILLAILANQHHSMCHSLFLINVDMSGMFLAHVIKGLQSKKVNICEDAIMSCVCVQHILYHFSLECQLNHWPQPVGKEQLPILKILAKHRRPQSQPMLFLLSRVDQTRVSILES